MFFDSFRYVGASLPGVYFTLFPGINTSFALCVMLVLVCLNLVRCLVEDLDWCLAEDTLETVCCVVGVWEGDGELELWLFFWWRLGLGLLECSVEL